MPSYQVTNDQTDIVNIIAKHYGVLEMDVSLTIEYCDSPRQAASVSATVRIADFTKAAKAESLREKVQGLIDNNKTQLMTRNQTAHSEMQLNQEINTYCKVLALLDRFGY